MASKGYPREYKTGYEIVIPSELEKNVFVAGAKLEGEKLLTSGGRVLGVTALGHDLADAIENAYKAVEKIHFENAYYRTDIGQKALAGGKK